jgi:glycosyltransferase involved in cell wall biosynthesis
MTTNPKLKIVLLCHFSNEMVRSKLPLSKLCLQNIHAKLFRKGKLVNYFDFAPWITNLINEFEKREDVEVHVISPHKGLNHFTFEFEINGVYYHFYRPDFPFRLDSIFYRLIKHKNRKYRLIRRAIKSYLNSISPDIVNLIGTENPYYSIASLDIKNVPIFVSVQTVYTRPNRKELTGSCDSFRWETEFRIHQKERYYGCGGRMHRDLILRNNPNAIIFKNLFPKKDLSHIKDNTKEFDFVFFAAHLTPHKGIEDAIDALKLVSEYKADVSLNVIGICTPEYRTFLNVKIKKIGLTNNISFEEYFLLQTDMFQHIKKSRFALLPIKLDVIPGTVIEAMQLGLPVITYKTTGTPFLNKDGQTVLLADIADIQKLAENMINLLESSALANQLIREAKIFVEKEYNGNNVVEKLISNFRLVLNHYHYDIPIPRDMLFDTEEFPLY